MHMFPFKHYEVSRNNNNNNNNNNNDNMVLFFILFVLTYLLAFVHLLSTKDRRMCLLFACHLSSLTSTRVLTTCLFSIPYIQSIENQQ